MQIDFNELKEVVSPETDGENSNVHIKMLMCDNNKIETIRLEEGTHITVHTHDTSSEIDYVLRGSGVVFIDNAVELLKPGVCHYCPKGSSHSIHNTGTEELVLFTVVTEVESLQSSENANI